MHVFLVDIDNGQAGSGLLVDNLTQPRLGLDNGVGDTHSLAESGQPDNQLDGLDIMGDQDQLGLLLLNQGGDVVQTELDNVGGSLVLNFDTLGLGLGDGHKTGLLGGLVLGTVLVDEGENTAGWQGGG